MNKIISLNGAWQIRWNDGERGERIARVLAGDVKWNRAWPANVPGSVHESLIAAGVIPEPNLGTNVLACRWVEETIWYYRRTFEAPELAAGERAWVFFESLDLAASVYLNGKSLGSHANAFHPLRVEVTDALRAGTNEIVVQVEAGLFHTMDRAADGYGLRLNHRLAKTPWLRKTQSQQGWDWSPRLMNVGIPGDVRLEIASGARWENLSVTSDLSLETKRGQVKARVFAENLGEAELCAELLIRIEETGQTERKQVKLAPGMNTLEANLSMENPELWWPVGHGSQTRYTVRVELRDAKGELGADSRRVGFREVRINQRPHPVEGRFFTVEVNGKPIFCKGGNYVPVDLILSRINRSRHEVIIDMALEANCNFLRVWGGGVYESADFYDLCDERGILVWQDFIFACFKYPATDEHFLADVCVEATHQVRRLAHHPSLIIWCGNNEIEWGSWEWEFEKGVAYPDYALYHLVLPRILRAEDPGRYYQPSSPFSPDGETANHNLWGDQHPWQDGFGDNDFRKYREMPCRFPNEGGILGPNSLPSVRAALAGGAEKPGSFAWELHDNSLTAWDNIPAYSPDLMLEQWLGKKVDDLSIEDYVYWAGVVQGCGLAEYIKNFRRRMFDSSAAVFWMLNDIWPCSRSWTIIDALNNRTPAFWPVRRAFQRESVVVVRENDTVRIFGVNDGPEIEAELHFGLLELKEAYPFERTIPVKLPGNASTVLAEFSATEWDTLGINKHVAFARLVQKGSEVARDALVLPFFREMEWPKASVGVEVANGLATFTSDSFAWRVCLDLDGNKPLSDNFFDVYPGIPTVLPWPESLGEPKILRWGNP